MRMFSSNTTGNIPTMSGVCVATGCDRIVNYCADLSSLTRACHRINSSIVANTAKNKKKAEKKKRALERRMSEGDAGSLEEKMNITTSSSFDLSELQDGWDEESHEDSGLSSSYEETVVITSDNSNQVNHNNVKHKPKSKRMTKRRSKTIQMANELIFDLDI